MQFNGTIQYEVKSGGGRDENGHPVSVASEWSKPIGCLFKRIKHSQIYQEGKFDISSYNILIESREFDADKIKLSDKKGKILGEYEVQEVSFPEGCGRVEIVV